MKLMKFVREQLYHSLCTHACVDILSALYCDIFHPRRLDKNEKREVNKLLSLKVNKKLLQQHISGSARKVVRLKDIQVGLHGIPTEMIWMLFSKNSIFKVSFYYTYSIWCMMIAKFNCGFLLDRTVYRENAGKEALCIG